MSTQTSFLSSNIATLNHWNSNFLLLLHIHSVLCASGPHINSRTHLFRHKQFDLVWCLQLKNNQQRSLFDAFKIFIVVESLFFLYIFCCQHNYCKYKTAKCAHSVHFNQIVWRFVIVSRRLKSKFRSSSSSSMMRLFVWAFFYSLNDDSFCGDLKNLCQLHRTQHFMRLIVNNKLCIMWWREKRGARWWLLMDARV